MINKNLFELIKKHCHFVPSSIPHDDGEVWVTKRNNNYVTRKGMEEDKKFLLKYGITEEWQSCGDPDAPICIGFNPDEQKWYGWSHRAIFGFGVGSRCKQGDCGFEPSNKEEFIEREVNFWGNCEYAVNGVVDYEEKGNGVLITYTYNDEVPNIKLRGTLFKHFSEYPKKWGRGSWKAKSLEDAKQMSINFAEYVS